MERSSRLANQWRIFLNNRRARYSLILLLGLFVLTLFAELLCNERPLLVRYEGRYFVPFLVSYPETTFGGIFETETNYQEPEVLAELSRKPNWAVWSPVRFGPTTIDFHLDTPAPSPPDKRHLLGTDDRARDVLARLIFGFRLSVVFGVLLATLGSILGVLAGSVQGFFGGKIDLLGQRLIEIWSSLPELFLLIILTSVFEPSLPLILVLMACMGWMGLAAYVRAEFLKSRECDYVLGARALGAPRWRVMFAHILPNSLAPVITFFPFRVSSAIAGLAALDFLGLGVPSPTPSLGELLAQGKSNLHSWWIILSTFAVMVLLILLLNFIGEGVQKAFDPRSTSEEPIG